MKKKLLFVVLVFVGFYFLSLAKNYYVDRYVVSDTYYLKVPENVDQTLEDLYDNQGNAVDTGKSYLFEAINLQGETRMVEFDFRTENVNDLLKPNDYVKVEVSETLVLSETIITQDEVPENILNYLD